MTSSHSTASSHEHRVTVVAGKTVQLSIHLAPVGVRIRAHANPGMGKALYLTGAS